MSNGRVHLQVVDHPLVADRLSVLRDENTTPSMFRYALGELTTMLVYEATREYATEEYEVVTPVQPTMAKRVSSPPLLVPVLRAGLGMSDSAYRLFPHAQMGFVGLARNEITHEPDSYLESLPADIGNRPTFILDPMLATGGSARQCLDALTARGAVNITMICILAAPEGLARLGDAGVEMRVFTASVDERLDENAFIVPGLGDAGDRQFGKV